MSQMPFLGAQRMRRDNWRMSPTKEMNVTDKNAGKNMDCFEKLQVNEVEGGGGEEGE